HGGGQLWSSGLLDLQSNTGQGSAESPQQACGGRMQPGGRRDSQSHHSCFAALDRARVRDRVVEAREQCAYLLLKRATRSGQLHPARPTLEQLHAQLVLQRANLLTERSLLDHQLLRGPGHVAFVCDREEVAELPEARRYTVLHMDGCVWIYWISRSAAA